MAELTLRICGLALRLAGDPALLSAARRRYAPFRGAGAADLELEVRPSARPLRFRGEEPRVERAGRLVRAAWDGLRVELSGKRGRALVNPPPARLDSALRIAMSFRLAAAGGFLCHAAAADGWLFPGPSGAGKTTLGRSVPGGRLLSDELSGVRGGRIYATPFWGEFRPGPNRGSRPLEALVFLDRGRPRGVHSLGKPEALARLLECVFFLGEDGASARRILRAARACVERAPCFALSYDARSAGFREVERMIREALT